MAFGLKRERQLKRFRPPIGWALLLVLALMLSWHFVVYRIMRAQYPGGIKINPITNVAVVLQ